MCHARTLGPPAAPGPAGSRERTLQLLLRPPSHRSRGAPVASRRQNGGDPVMEAVTAAIIRGDYPQAYDLLRQAPEAATVSGRAMAAVLLALTERFDEADQVVADEDLAGLRV